MRTIYDLFMFVSVSTISNYGDDATIYASNYIKEGNTRKLEDFTAILSN